MQCLSVTMGDKPDPKAAIFAVRRLSALVEIPAKLSEISVTNDFPQNMAKDAYESGNARLVNPRTPTVKAIIDLYNQAL
jgi:alcohol dehydrogenase class IV